MAVDTRFIPPGALLSLDLAPREGVGPIRRLVVVRDTGGAIRGVGRGDLFRGVCLDAYDRTGRMLRTLLRRQLGRRRSVLERHGSWCRYLVDDITMKVTNDAMTPYLERLRALPFVTEAAMLKTRSSDGGPRLRLRTPTAKFERGVVLHGRNLDRVSATLIAERVASEATASIVFAPAVSEPLGELFEQRGVAFVDRQGNCSLRLDDQYIARIQGRRATRPEPKDRGIRAAGYQVMLALLTVPELARRPLREIAAAAGTSVTAPADMLRRLTDEGYLARTRHGLAWVETRREELVDRFLVGYRDVLRPRLLVGRYKTPLGDPRKLEARLVDVLGGPDAWRWGGAAAGYRVTRHYRSPRTVVHHPAWSVPMLAKIPAMASPDGDLIVLRSPGAAALQGPQPTIVHPLLIVAELLAEPDERGWQVAAEIRETLRS